MVKRDPLKNPEPLIRRIYAYAAYRVGDGPDAEDVVATTLERAWHHRDGYDRRHGDIDSWLIGIAARRVAELLAGRPQDPGARAAGPRPAPSDRHGLRRAVARLTERDRELVALRYGAGFTTQRIAELLDVRSHTVEAALEGLLRTLSGRPEPVGGGPPRREPGRGAAE